MSNRHIAGPRRPVNHGTIYDGTFFFSRTAATWASFFDRINWPWRYRPLLRNGWTPDFCLGRDIERAVPCIVLPIHLDNVPGDEMRDAQEPYRDIVGRAEEKIGSDRFLVLDKMPFPNDEGHMSSVGWHMGSPNWHGDKLGSAYLSVDKNNGQLDFVLGGPPYLGAVTGRSYDYGTGRINPFVFFGDDLLPIWRSAAEAVKGGGA